MSSNCRRVLPGMDARFLLLIMASLLIRPIAALRYITKSTSLRVADQERRIFRIDDLEVSTRVPSSVGSKEMEVIDRLGSLDLGAELGWDIYEVDWRTKIVLHRGDNDGHTANGDQGSSGTLDRNLEKIGSRKVSFRKIFKELY